MRERGAIERHEQTCLPLTMGEQVTVKPGYRKRGVGVGVCGGVRLRGVRGGSRTYRPYGRWEECGRGEDESGTRGGTAVRGDNRKKGEKDERGGEE